MVFHLLWYECSESLEHCNTLFSVFLSQLVNQGREKDISWTCNINTQEIFGHSQVIVKLSIKKKLKRWNTQILLPVIIISSTCTTKKIKWLVLLFIIPHVSIAIFQTKHETSFQKLCSDFQKRKVGWAGSDYKCGLHWMVWQKGCSLWQEFILATF